MFVIPPSQVQDSIDQRLEKRRKGVFGPPLGSRIAIFVDDMNLPVRETFGASPCSEILRQLIGQGGWYDRKELSFRSRDVLYSCIECRVLIRWLDGVCKPPYIAT
jgi:dynein heavy chain